MLLTDGQRDKQRERQTNKRYQKHNLLAEEVQMSKIAFITVDEELLWIVYNNSLINLPLTLTYRSH